MKGKPSWLHGTQTYFVLFLLKCFKSNSGSFMQDMPSVERFDDTDFQALSRRIIESTAECAICLAALEVGEDSNEGLGDLN